MTAPRAAVLTPPGTGAIATVAVAGPGAWAAVRARFRPAGGSALPDEPAAGRFWFGTLGDGVGDEVVVAVPSSQGEPRLEVHCHGGRRVVRWVVEQFLAAGCVEVPAWELVASPPGTDPRALEPLSRAPTLRTAAVLLDQYHGAFGRAVADVLAAVDRDDLPSASQVLGDLARFAPVGRHLVEPWRVVIAGPPNVGKSSLINALAGYQRSVVAPVAGTTRDVVTAAVAFDGWPVELSDTAGLRLSADVLEAAGVALARGRLAAADLVVWVVDATAPEPEWPGPDAGPAPLVVVNKTDVAARPHAPTDAAYLPASAVTGAGVAELAAAIAARLVPTAPPPGTAVPFTSALATAVTAALAALTARDVPTARKGLIGLVGLTASR